MMFHRTPGKMDEAVEAMRRYVPYYAETTNGHGRCTDCIMAGEAALLRGNFAVPSRFMRKFVCRLRLSEVSRQ